jgi:O-antigen ligase
LKRLTLFIDRYLVYLLSFVFIALNLFLLSKDIWWLGILPIFIIFILIAVFRLDTLLFLTVFFVPLSYPLHEIITDTQVDLALPTELFLILILFLIILKNLKGESFHKKILLHPITIAIYVHLAWMLVTSFTSTMPLVSFKFLLSRIWFIIAFYFLASELFRRNTGNIYKYIWSYLIPLLLVIAYTTNRHISIGLFNQKAAHSVMGPFYNDHTAYGAVLAMVIPVVAGIIFEPKRSLWHRIISGAVLAVVSMALVLSFSRAAWISLIVAVVVFFIVILKIKFHTLLLFLFVILVAVFSQFESIKYQMAKNRQESSANLTENFQSISNITTDDSNRERLNRWSCAWRMFLQKPVFGWGPGTYMFQYAPFQIVREKTSISTNMADRGTAHSEYLGPLSESGLLGMLSILSVIILTLITGFKTFAKLNDLKYRIITLSVLIGLITYYVHGILNNFLDTDKASALFWGFTAMIVVINSFVLNDEKSNADL